VYSRLYENLHGFSLSNLESSGKAKEQDRFNDRLYIHHFRAEAFSRRSFSVISSVAIAVGAVLSHTTLSLGIYIGRMMCIRDVSLTRCRVRHVSMKGMSTRIDN
jgi:hypothetical protein